MIENLPKQCESILKVGIKIPLILSVIAIINITMKDATIVYIL